MSTPLTPESTPQTRRAIHLIRLLWIGPLAAILSVGVNLLIRYVAVTILVVTKQHFGPLSVRPITRFTIYGVIGATVVFAIVAWLSKQPVRRYTQISVVALLLSYLPDFGLLTPSSPFKGATIPAVICLILMHTATAIICVMLLTKLTQERKKL